MRQLGRFALLVTVALAAAGCSSGADAPNQGSTSTVTNDPAFTVAKLRAIDPCGLLDYDTLHPQSDPTVDTFAGTPDGLEECDIDMKDYHRYAFKVAVTVGAGVITRGSHTTLSGMPVLELPTDGECEEQIFTPDPKLGILVDITAEYNSCAMARAITTAMINHIRTNPPKRPNSSGSLTAIDPCTTVDLPTLAAAIGPGAPMSQENLYDCMWEGPLWLSVVFQVGDAQVPDYGQTPPQPVDLGGVTGYQVRPDPQSCQIGWNVRPTGQPHQFELVYVEINNLGTQPVDTCAKTLQSARAVRTKVPTR